MWAVYKYIFFRSLNPLLSLSTCHFSSPSSPSFTHKRSKESLSLWYTNWIRRWFRLKFHTSLINQYRHLKTEVFPRQGGSNGRDASGLILSGNGRRFLTPLACAGRLLTGWKAVCLGKSGGVRLRPVRAKAAFHPVSTQPAQTWRQKTSPGVIPL